MKKLAPIKFFILASLLLAFSCSTDEFEAVEGLCPLVVSTIPEEGTINVPLDQIISVTFNKIMNPATINETSFTVNDGNPIPGTITFENNEIGTTAFFTPSSDLSLNTTYTGRITTAVKDSDGNAMQVAYAWSFSTGTVLAPVVLTTDPENEETDVVLNKVITATFNQLLDPSTLTSTSFVITSPTTTLVGDIEVNGAIVSFTPNADLEFNTTYTATLTTDITNIEGIALANEYVWTFTTGTAVAPTVILTDPFDEETDVVLNKIITATFSEVMNPATITSASFKVNNGTIDIPGSFSFNGAMVRFTPNPPLTSNTTYTATITTAVENAAGTSLANNYVWTFSTGNLVAPTVISTDPEDNDTDVPLNKVITATFSEIMDPATLNNSTFSLVDENSNNVPVSYGFNGVVVSFTPNDNLEPDTTYTATITTGAENMAGVGLESDYTWSFTTAAASVQLPDIGTIENFGGFGGNAGLTNQGLNTVINNGGIGTTAASTLVTGFHDGLTGDIYTETTSNVGLVTGGIFTAPPFPGTAQSFAIAQQALSDAQALYTAISPAAMPGGSDPGAGELGGLVLPPGVYQSASGTFNITNGDLTLDAQGDPNALWVFQTSAGLTVGIAGPTGAKSVNLVNGANAANVFWQVGSAATINAAGGGVMVGTIVSMAGVTLSTAGNEVLTVLNGRAISLVASVTMVNTIINVPN